jgi:hypothetical protein
MLSFTGGGGGSSIQCARKKYVRFAESGAKNTFFTRGF